jgi:hypothetical protein
MDADVAVDSSRALISTCTLHADVSVVAAGCGAYVSPKRPYSVVVVVVVVAGACDAVTVDVTVMSRRELSRTYGKGRLFAANNASSDAPSGKTVDHATGKGSVGQCSHSGGSTSTVQPRPVPA